MMLNPSALIQCLVYRLNDRSNALRTLAWEGISFLLQSVQTDTEVLPGPCSKESGVLSPDHEAGYYFHSSAKL